MVREGLVMVMMVTMTGTALGGVSTDLTAEKILTSSSYPTGSRPRGTR
jgi:hypothetical protein